MKNNSKELKLKQIATIYTDFPEKFGIPRQSGLTSASGKIVFEEEYKVKEAIRGIDQYSHLWIIWGFSEVTDKKWSPTVRPPRLGGNKRVGVFATRSPFRPNPIALSSVKLEEVCWEDGNGWVLVVSGVDMMDGTPIYDIKPYLPYVDCHCDAKGGFAEEKKDYRLQVEIPKEYKYELTEEKQKILEEILAQDPRPAYQEAKDREYGLAFESYEIKFQVIDNCVYVRELKRRY